MLLFHRLHTRCLVALLLLAPVLAGPAAAQSDADSLARAFKTQQQLPGLVVAFTGPDGRRVRSYGVAALEDSTRLTADTRFEIGSVTKVFTALLLADAAERGAVALDAPIGRYLPDSVDAPTHEEQSIQLLHLATHTSGLPSLPANLNVRANPRDPYVNYGAPALHAFLDGYELPRASGAQYAYSNLGAGLLGHLLARQSGTSSYPALLRRRVLAPLGLGGTYVPPPADTTDAALAQGYAAPGQPASYWRFDTLAGAGALRSTTADLLRFLEQQLAPGATPLSAAIRRTHERRPDLPGPVALGWHVASPPDVAGPLYWHNGGTGGFRSFVGFLPEEQRGVVVLTNGGIPVQTFTQFAFEVVQAAR